jgi:hypothetical protein
MDFIAVISSRSFCNRKLDIIKPSFLMQSASWYHEPGFLSSYNNSYSSCPALPLLSQMPLNKILPQALRNVDYARISNSYEFDRLLKFAHDISLF